MASSTGQSPHSQVQAQPHDRMTAFGASSSNQPAGHVDTYDPARISQWAAHSATGPPVVPNYGAHDQCNFTYGSDMLSANMASQMPSQFPGSQSGDPNAFHSVPLPGVYGPGTTYNESSTSSAEADFARLGMDHEMAPDPGFGFPSALNGDHYSNVLSSSIDDRSFSTFSPGELPSFDPAEANPPFVIGNGNNGLSLSLPWEASGFDVAQPLEWSPASGLTPSSSSMQSSHSFLGHQPDTPVSAMAYDGVYAVNPRGPLDGDSGMIPPFSLGEAVVPQPSIGFVDPERFAPTTDNLVSFQSDAMPSTIRPSENFQRAPLSMDMWASNDTANQSYGLPVAYNGFDGSRRSSEGEVKNARDHVFYKATTKDDSMYHCPYIATEKCTHKPDKLKCNYE